jgi:hypothetical protein
MQVLQELVDFEGQNFERGQPRCDGHVLVVGPVDPVFTHHHENQVEGDLLNRSCEFPTVAHRVGFLLVRPE